MDALNDNDLALTKFGVGQPVARKEDPTLLRGEGRYTDDVKLPDQAYAVMARSRIAHGAIRAIDADAARAMPGVLGVFIPNDLAAAGYGPIKPAILIPNRDGSPMRAPLRPALPRERVRFVGEAVAFVVAETMAQAKDAAETVSLDIDPLPVVTTPAAALAPGAPQLHAEAPGNAVVDYHYGETAAVDAAFAKAAHVTRLSLISNRIVVNALEPRAAVAAYAAESGRFTLHLGCQGVFGLRNAVKDILGVAADKVHVLTGNVGGSFGMKASVFPEYVCLLHAARALGRPVKWTDERGESFLSDHHGRDHEMKAELALDRDGDFLAVL